MGIARKIDGIDLSHYQADLKIVWPEAKKAGVKFLIHKATESTDWTDPSYPVRRAEAKKAGVLFGAYHYAHPEVGNAEAEALHFLSYASPARGDLVPALDLEWPGMKMSEDQLSTWVETFFSVVFKTTGVQRGILYTQRNLTHVPKGVVLWASRYNNDNRLPVPPQPFTEWTMWQFTDGKLGVPSAVPGVGRVDASTLARQYGLGAIFGYARLGHLTIPRKKRQKVKAPVVKETEIQRLLRIAASQNGYKEGFSNGHWNNQQKFSLQVPSLRWSNGQPWCCTYVSWCAQKAGLAALFPCTASCAEAEAWWKARNQWHEYPAIGAQVIYGNGEHTGIVDHFDADYIWAWEGNTNSTGGAEGYQVMLKKRLRRDPYVSGYGYPAVAGGLVSADPNYKRSN